MLYGKVPEQDVKWYHSRVDYDEVKIYTLNPKETSKLKSYS